MIKLFLTCLQFVKVSVFLNPGSRLHSKNDPYNTSTERIELGLNSSKCLAFTIIYRVGRRTSGKITRELVQQDDWDVLKPCNSLVIQGMGDDTS